MVTVTIGQESRSGSDIAESWINQQINRRLRDAAPVCVMVTVKDGDLDMVLRTTDCPRPTGYGRAPNQQERRVFDLWEKLHLQHREVRSGNLVGFLKQMGWL